MNKTMFCFFYHPHTYDMVPNAQMGLGLLSLATYADRLGAPVSVVNAQSLTIPEALSNIPECSYLMLYGCLIDLPILETIARYAKRSGAATIVCVGGPIANSVKEIRDVELVVPGFGEDFVSDVSHIRVVDFVRVIRRTKKEYCSLSKNINDYPFPDRSLLVGEYGGNIFKRKDAFCETSTTILTSRGCKYKCAFCSSGKELFLAEYKIGRIERELESCLSLGITNIRISDDNLVNSRTRLSQICGLFREAGIKWRASIRAVPSSIDMYEEMVFSGCEELSFGIESGDQHVLNVLQKGTTVQQNIDAISNANKAGVNITRALLMMGTPGETEETLGLNISWVEQACPNIVSLKIFVPYPNTHIYEHPSIYGYSLLSEYDTNNSAYRPDGTEAHANISTKEMSADLLTKQFHRMKEYLEMKGIENRG